MSFHLTINACARCLENKSDEPGQQVISEVTSHLALLDSECFGAEGIVYDTELFHYKPLATSK